MPVNANQFPGVYDQLGVNVNQLGAIMLDVEPFEVVDYVEGGKADLHVSPNAERFWIDGAVAESEAHLTLLMGLMESGLTWRGLVDTVLDGWNPPPLQIVDVDVFRSPFDDEPYSCIVGHVKVTPELLEGRQRLQLLPHVDTFSDYRPHITLAYVEPEAESKWLSALRQKSAGFIGSRHLVTKINYGGNK